MIGVIPSSCDDTLHYVDPDTERPCHWMLLTTQLGRAQVINTNALPGSDVPGLLIDQENLNLFKTNYQFQLIWHD